MVMNIHRYIVVFSLLVSSGVHAQGLERVAMPPNNYVAAFPKPADSAPRFHLVRTPFTMVINAYDPDSGIKYAKQAKPTKKGYPYYAVYDSTFGCYANIDKIVDKVGRGDDESSIESPLSILHMTDPNWIDGGSNLTPLCVYASNLSAHQRGIHGSARNTTPVDDTFSVKSAEITLTNANRAEILALPDHTPPVKTQVWYDKNR